MILKNKIFRAYDIRGEAFVDFDEDGFFAIAAAFGEYIKQKYKIKKPKIFVSGDGRLSMEELWPATIAGLQAAGCDSIWGGIVPTPVNSFAFHEGNFDGAMQISASHNPSSDNGLKLTDKEGAVCGEQIQTIRKMAECTTCRKTSDFGECGDKCKTNSFEARYEKKLRSITSPQTPLEIVVDCGNGVAGILYPNIFRKFGHQLIELFCDLDTSFPNHQPDPEEKKNLQDLILKVQEERADFGFAFDGDGDRVGIILHNGDILSADKILYILAADFLKRNPKEKIVVDAMTSATLIEKLQKLSGDVIISPTGHSHIMNKMREAGALLGGEQSGHEFFGENFYGHDDAMLASLRFISAIQSAPSLILDVTKRWPSLLEYSEKFPVADEKKFQILEKVETRLIASLTGDMSLKISTLDGVRIDFGKGEWAIIRCSNTSPKISVRIEAQNKESLEKKKEMIVGPLKKYL
ncbi:phosphomannomutase/phosphoglucomutase [Candidatus Gracilibacteria bacterium]|nr:phosphomannomutase/phosphoglucomutase [Candidatus Gracilibacteria bacterium]